MSNIDRDLERAGDDFRQAANTLDSQTWGTMTAKRRTERRLWAVTIGAAAVLLLALPMIFFRGGASPDSGFAGPGTTTTVHTQPSETTMAVVEQPLDAETVVTVPVVMQLEDPPHLLLEADGWEMVRYSEMTYQPAEAGGKTEPLVFRPAGAGIGEPTLSAAVFEFTDVVGWSVGEGAERIELDGRTVSVMADFILPAGHAAGVEFDDGTFVVVEGFGMERGIFIDAISSVTIAETGELLITPPLGYEQVEVPVGRTEIVTRREAQHRGPNGAGAEVRIWSGNLAEVEAQVLNRALEARSVRTASIDKMPVAVTYHSDDLSRVFVVGGTDGYVIEIDFSLLGVNATDADLDALLSSIRLVDIATFEDALPEGSVTTGSVEAVVAEMLSDIPVPVGFDPSGLTATGERYQVGAQVVSAVTCSWIDQWVVATAAGDTELADIAVAALSTSREWSILIEMESQGGYSGVVWEYADAIAGDGTVVGGRVLTVEESYQAALGCN